MSLTYFWMDADVTDLVPDTADAGGDPDTTGFTGLGLQIYFDLRVDSGVLLRASVSPRTQGVWQERMVGYIRSDGRMYDQPAVSEAPADLTDPGNIGVRMLASGPELGLTNPITYLVSSNRLELASGKRWMLKAFNVAAPTTDSRQSLFDLSPVTTNPLVQIPASVTSVGGVTGAVPGGAAGMSVLASDTEAEARAALGLGGTGEEWTEVANFAALPSPGDTAEEYVTLDTGQVWRWTGSTYVTGNAATATKLQTARNINGVPFDGTANIASLAGQASNITASTAPAIGQINVYDDTSGSLTPTLPQLSGEIVGAQMMVQKFTGGSLTNTVTFTAYAGDAFDNASTARVLRLQGEFEVLQVISVSGTKKWKVISDGKTLGSLDYRYQAGSQVRRPLNNVCIVIGESTTTDMNIYQQVDGLSQAPGDWYNPVLGGSYFDHLCVQSFQRIRNGGLYCTNAYTMTQVLTNIVPVVTALNPAPGACIIGAGVCDMEGVPFATTVAALKGIVAQLLAAKIIPILRLITPTISPAAGLNPYILQWNAWLRRYASLNGLPLIDAYSPCVGVNGQGLAGYLYSVDGDDPFPPAHAAIAQQALSDGLADIFNPVGTGGLTSKSSADLTNLFGSGSLNWGVFTTNTSGVGTGLGAYGTVGAFSIVAPTASDQLSGNWQQLTVPAGTTTGQKACQSGAIGTAGTTWHVGDTMAFSARVQTSQMAGNFLICTVHQTIPGGYVMPNGDTYTTVEAGMFPWASDVEDGLLYVEFPILPGTTELQFWLAINPGPGLGVTNTAIVNNPVVRVGEVTLVNLTTQGLLV